MSQRAAGLLTALILAVGLPPLVARAQVGLSARGEAIIRGGNKISAREEAIQAALRTAIEQAVGTRIDSATFVAEKRVIADKVLSRASGYVERYEVRKEGTSEDGKVYWVQVRAVVNDQTLDRDLAALNVVQHLRERPRMAILVGSSDVRELTATARVAEAYRAGGDFRAAAEAALRQGVESALLDANFRLADQATVADAFTRDQTLVGDILNDPAAAQRLAQRLEAEYLVVVTVAPEPPEPMPQNDRIQLANITAQATVISRDAGRVVASVSGRGNGGDVSASGAVSRAAQNAGQDLGRAITRRMGEFLRGEVSDTAEITIVLTKLSSRRHFILVRQFLEGLEQTRGVHEDGYTAGTATLRAEYAGKATTLADKLALQQFPGFWLEPRNVDQNKILLEVQEEN